MPKYYQKQITGKLLGRASEMFEHFHLLKSFFGSGFAAIAAKHSTGFFRHHHVLIFNLFDHCTLGND